MIPLYETGGKSTCVLGMPMCQNRLAVPTWSYAMEVHPPAQVIEIGTYSGGFAAALASHTSSIGAALYTFDVNEPIEWIERRIRFLGGFFRRASCWDVEREISNLIMAPYPTFLLCDGGDKKRELATFAEYLKPGDVIGVHDFDMFEDTPEDIAPNQLLRPWPWCEIRERDARPIAEKHDLEPWLQQHFDLAGWLVYKKRL